MAEVGARLGYTVNTGNFENAKAEFWHSDTVRDDESVGQAQTRVYEQVERELISRLQELVEEIEEVKTSAKAKTKEA